MSVRNGATEPRTPTRVGCPKCETRWPRAAPPPHHRRLLAISSAARPPSPSAPRRSPLREFADSRSRRTTESQHQNGVLLPRAISLPILTALCSCFASADRIRLRPRCRIITDSTSPSLLGVVCSSDTLIDRRVCSLFTFGQREDAHRIGRATRTANVMRVLSLYIDSRGGQRTTLSTIISTKTALF